MIRIGPLDVSLERRELRLAGEVVRIGSRAFDILELLIHAQGELVSKEEIMRRVWPHTVVSDNSLQVHIAALRKALASDHDLIRTVSGRGYRLIGDRSDSAGASAPRTPSRRTRDTGEFRPLRPPTELIGRHDTVERTIDMLDTECMVTLVGTGGIGKTRVAVEVATRIGERFADGVVFVPLESISDSRLAVEALASALGFISSTKPLSLDAVVTALAGRHMLVVLDNCEHVIDAAARIAYALSGTCDGITVLATSREALRIPGECLHRISPLDVPDEHQRCDDPASSSAVQLFVERVRAADSRVPLDRKNLELIATICRRLDGIPLAIELAASRAAVLGIKDVNHYLYDPFRLLTGGSRIAPQRHQALHACLEWSYRLLSEAERMLLRWLGVFPNGFSLDAAHEVVANLRFTRSDLFDTLGSLIAKSLVIRENVQRGAERYRLFATTRSYAMQKLAESGEGNAASRAHAQYFQALFAQAEPRCGNTYPIADHIAVQNEIDNLREAFDWAFSPDGDLTIGVALAMTIVPCLFNLSLIGECRERARVALEATVDPALAPVPADTRLRLAAAYVSAIVNLEGPQAAEHGAWADARTLVCSIGAG